ncbi:MAG: hypothetical protein ACYCWW_13205 [Deltaproteobacteria bacterium]
MRRLAPCLALSVACCSAAQQQTINDTISQVEATHAVAVTLLDSPAVPFPDGGSSGSVAVASVFFGARSATDTTKAPTALPGAAVSLSDSDGAAASCADQGNGDYLASSLDGGLRYDSGATYTFTVVLDGGTYVATGVAPAPEHVTQFAPTFTVDGGVPSASFTTVSVGQGFTLTRDPNPDGGPLDIAFVTVNLITGGSASAQPTYTNVPQTPLALLELVAPGGDGPYRAQSIAVPASAFPQAGDYLVTLTAVKEGGPQSNNLFALSAVLIGAGTAGILQAQ